MILHLVADQHGWRFEPHGEEPVAWYCDVVGGDILRASGWRPYEMHRVSAHVYRQLIRAGHLRVLYDISQPKLLELRGMEVELPVGGDHADQVTLH
jgi:hypothetical protein